MLAVEIQEEFGGAHAQQRGADEVTDGVATGSKRKSVQEANRLCSLNEAAGVAIEMMTHFFQTRVESSAD